MNFKEFLLNELTEVTPQIQQTFRDMNAEQLLYTFHHNIAFIYSAETDKVYYKAGIDYHGRLLAALEYGGTGYSHPPSKDADRESYRAANKVYDYGKGAVGRIGKGMKYHAVIPDDVRLVAFYRHREGFTTTHAKRAVELLLQENQLAKTDLVTMWQTLEPVYKFLGQSDVADFAYDKNSERITDPKRIEELRQTYKTGRTPDGRDLSAPERAYIKRLLDMEDSKLMKKNPWQAALEKEKLISPGTNFRTPYSDATNYEL